MSADLRLLELSTSADGVRLLFEVRSDVRAKTGWEGATLRAAVHVLGAGDEVRVFDGPRSADLSLRWAHLRRPVGSVTVPHAMLDGATGIELDLVLEGVSWGRPCGIEPIYVPISVPSRSVDAQPGRGVEAWPDDLEELIGQLCSAWPAGANPREMEGYARADAARFVFTVQLAAARPASRCLEIGSNPYFTTRLLKQRLPGAVLAGTNWFGAAFTDTSQDVVDASGAVVDTFRFENVEVETQPLPFEDGAFDLVVFGEVIEHFIADPVHALAELHRVLEPGGRMVLTTPNVARAANRVRLDTFQSIYDPYSAYGPHGRHNREYSGEELFELLEGNGFRVERYVTRPVHGLTEWPPGWFDAADDDGRGDYHFLEATRVDRHGEHRPPWLYR